MEAIYSAVDGAARIYRPVGSYEEVEPETQGVMHKPTEHQIRDETNATPPVAENQLPTLGPSPAIYLNKPIVTTTNETSKLTSESPGFQNLSLRSSSPPPKYTAAASHRRVDSGIGEMEINTGRTPQADAYQRPGHGGFGDDDIQRTAREIDDESHTTEGYPRPVFVAHEESGDSTCRADGRDRVQFGNSKGSTGSLKPSGEPNPERPGQGSAGEMPYMDLGKQGSVPPRARIGTVQGGTVRDRQRELEAAQTAQSGGLGGIPAVFGTGGYDPTGTAQVQKEYHSWSKPNVRGSTKDSDLQQAKGVLEDEAQGQHISQRGQGKPPQEDCQLQQESGKEKTIPQSPQKKDDSRPDTDAAEKSHSTVQASPTSTTVASAKRSDEHLPSSNQPYSQDGTTNAATTNAISPMGPGLSKGTHGPVEPSVGADPAHVQQQTQKHQGGDRPAEEPKGDAPQPSQGGRGSQGSQGREKEERAGHLWIKSTGTAADGGDFDAAKPGAGKEADRLLEQAGVHRSVDPRHRKEAEGDTRKGVKGNQHKPTTTSGNPANPTHHPDSAADSGKHGKLHMPGILHHHHHDTNNDTASSESGGAHKGGLGDKLEKIKEKVKLRKD
ncbi:hypothetical protein EV426DRAFT_61038 [Tirmania nivea]|nr:hypothetical protein EV426DRAFT_61038 [Tirmania nivea]